MVSCALGKDLKQKYTRNSLPVRKGDLVELMRGSYKGTKGEVVNVDLKKCKVYVQGVTSKKADGTDVERPVHPSNLRIVELNADDKERRDVLARTQEAK